MSVRTYLTFRVNDEIKLETQIFENDFYDTKFFTEILKLAELNIFPECEEVEVPFDKVFVLMEDVLDRELRNVKTKLFKNIEFKNAGLYYMHKNEYVNNLLNFTDDFISRWDKFSDNANNEVELERFIPNTFNGFTYKILEIVSCGKIFETYNLIQKLIKNDLLTDNKIRAFIEPTLKENVKCFISQC